MLRHLNGIGPRTSPCPSILLRERVVAAAAETGPCCNSDRLCNLGKDNTETLALMSRQRNVVPCGRTAPARSPGRRRHVMSCHVMLCHAPRRRFGPSFLVMLLCETFGAHQPLNHQRVLHVREGVDLSLSTLADPLGDCAATL